MTGRARMGSLIGGLTYSNVTATLALFLALAGGVAIAAGKIGAREIKSNAVRAKHIKDGQVGSAEVKANSLTAADIDEATLAVVPEGAVAYFDRVGCPSGWSEFSAARGRYVVGLPAGGALKGTAGTALSNLENRAVGRHNHTVTDPGHGHLTSLFIGATDEVNGFGVDRANEALETLRSSDNRTTGISINDAGGVAGTNAPYVQLLACRRE